MKTVLITGCAGFIGSHVTESLLAKNYRVIGLDNFDAFYSREIKNKNISSFIQHPNFQMNESDIRDALALDKITVDPDAVIHLASRVGVINSLRLPGEYFDNNLYGTRNILEWMQKRKIKKLVFASSSSVYGNNPQKPFSENDAADRPISPYAFTKKACELLIYNHHHLYQLDALCLRFFTVYGPRQRPDLAIHKFLRLIRRGEKIPVYGDGSTARDYTYIEDTINGVLNSLEYVFSKDHVYEIINLGNDSPGSFANFILDHTRFCRERNNVFPFFRKCHFRHSRIRGS